MTFDHLNNKSNRNNLKQSDNDLSGKYQNLYVEKLSEIEEKEDKISKLSKRVRYWMQKYHRMELSTQKKVNDSELADNQDNVQYLQDMVVELRQKNRQLERRLKAHTLANGSESKTSCCEVIEISKANKIEETNETVSDFDKDQLKFSPKFQALLEQHAQKCNA